MRASWSISWLPESEPETEPSHELDADSAGTASVYNVMGTAVASSASSELSPQSSTVLRSRLPLIHSRLCLHSKVPGPHFGAASALWSDHTYVTNKTHAWNRVFHVSNMMSTLQQE